MLLICSLIKKEKHTMRPAHLNVVLDEEFLGAQNGSHTPVM
jgi:hypothetical protein